MPTIKENKEEFIRLLQSTNREGVDDTIAELESLGFFEAPASSTQHLNTEGGLLQHSLKVCKCA
ncbi:MAG: HD family phosphohydrolase, partial [Muribaculaceae bacterium]